MIVSYRLHWTLSSVSDQHLIPNKNLSNSTAAGMFGVAAIIFYPSVEPITLSISECIVMKLLLLSK